MRIKDMHPEHTHITSLQMQVRTCYLVIFTAIYILSALHSIMSLMWLQVMDMLVEQTHNIDTQMRDGEKPMRFTDTRLDEQERGVSLKMVPMSLVLEGTSGKSYLMNLIDTPGAQYFFDLDWNIMETFLHQTVKESFHDGTSK